jgi:hypothetical protein
MTDSLNWVIVVGVLALTIAAASWHQLVRLLTLCGVAETPWPA